jgi:hypothetical protein
MARACFLRYEMGTHARHEGWATATLACEDRGPYRLNRLDSINDVKVIAIAILKEGKAVALGRRAGFTHPPYTLLFESGMGFIEIVNRDGDVTDARGTHGLCGSISLRRNELNHAAVGSLREHEGAISVVDMESENIDVPLGKSFRIGGSDRCVFDALKHSQLKSNGNDGRSRVGIDLSNWSQATETGTTQLPLLCGRFAARRSREEGADERFGIQ